MSEKMLTTGAFARLCKTTKETIFHYDRENLLKPRRIGSNGYRYYSLDQLWDFESIATLKDIGISLQDIRYYLQDTKPERLLSFLQEKDRDLDREIARLAQRKLFLGDMLKSLEELSDSRLGTVTFARQEETLLEVWPIEPSTAEDTRAFWETFYAYLGFYREQNKMARWPFGTILQRVEQQSSSKATPAATSSATSLDAQVGYAGRFFFGLATEQGEGARSPADKAGKEKSGPLSLYAQKAGLYAVCFHEGTYTEQERALAAFVRLLEQRGLRHDEQIFCSDMLVYARHEDQTSYVNRYSVRIEEGDNTAELPHMVFPLV